MTIMYGADAAELEALAAELDGAGDELGALLVEGVGAVSLVGLSATLNTIWRGPRASEFSAIWQSRHLLAVRQVQGLLEEAASDLRSNAEQQRRASGGASAPTGGSFESAVTGRVDPIPESDAYTGSVTGNRSWQEVKKTYDAWATGRFAEGGVSHYQCTGWANFRWAELGYQGPAISGHGGNMAANAGPVSADPSLHAMASYRSGEFGHVMVVEEVAADGSWIRVSEMNVGDGNPYVATADEYRDDRTFHRSADGKFYNRGRLMEFAAFPGS